MLNADIHFLQTQHYPATQGSEYAGITKASRPGQELTSAPLFLVKPW